MSSVATPVGTLRIACDDETWTKLEPLLPALKDVSNAQSVERVAEAGPEFVETDSPLIRVAAELLEQGDG